MNNPINAPQSPNELVLRLIGGERDGQLFTVENEKCLLSDLSPGIVDAENYRCVIFRGEKGVAFRSYSDHVLCNGAKVSVQWLKKGDLIKVTDSFSVEIYQLGVYTKKAAAPTPRTPMNTVEIPSKVDPGPSSNPSVVARPETKTIVSSSPSATTPPSSVSAPLAPPAGYAKPSVEFPSVSASSTAEAPKFKPATENLRAPAVTAPLATHQLPTESPAPAPSVSRMPVVTQAIDIQPQGTNSSPENKVENLSLTTQSPAAPPVAPLGRVPSAPSNATIDSLSDRLSKLVNSAGEDGNSESIETPPSNRPSVSTMVIEPTLVDPETKSTEAALEGLTEQSSAAAQPEQTSPSTPNTERMAAPTIASSPVSPIAEAVDSVCSTDAAPQPTTTDSAADRRSALENYFSKTGVSLSDATSPPEDEVALTDAVSPEATPVEPTVPVTPSAPVESSVLPTDQSRQSMATEAITESPKFNLDSVLAKLESGSSDPSSQTPAVESSQDQQAPVAATAVSETLVVETPVAETPVVAPPGLETPVVEDAIEQPPVAAHNKDESTSEATNGDQGGQLESFALLQSLGLDTSGLGQIKKELTEAPLREEIESISLNTQQQAEPEASAPEKVESVADVLARMQNAGSLQDFKAGEEEAEASAVETAQQQAPTPPPAAPQVPPPASSPAPGNESNGAAAGSGAAEDDGSVEDYMSQLLNRMRGDSEPTSGEVAGQKQDDAVEKIAAAQQVLASPTQPEKTEKLTQEEFKPKQKAVRMQSLDSLREIANSNAREAFRDSLAKERKVSTQTKLTLSMVSLAFAVLFFLMSYMKEQVNFWGVVFGIGFLIIGILTARTYLSERKLDRSILSD